MTARRRAMDGTFEKTPPPANHYHSGRWNSPIPGDDCDDCREVADCPNCAADSNSRAQCGRCLDGPHDGPCYHDDTPAKTERRLERAGDGWLSYRVYVDHDDRTPV